MRSFGIRQTNMGRCMKDPETTSSTSPNLGWFTQVSTIPQMLALILTIEPAALEGRQTCMRNKLEISNILKERQKKDRKIANTRKRRRNLGYFHRCFAAWVHGIRSQKLKKLTLQLSLYSWMSRSCHTLLKTSPCSRLKSNTTPKDSVKSIWNKIKGELLF